MNKIKRYWLPLTLGVVLGFVYPAIAGRNSGGTFSYTSPGGPVVSSGTTISSTWANTSMTEIGTALTDSLSRTGYGGMAAQLKLINGTTAAPGVVFSSSLTSGLSYTTGATPYVSMSVGGGAVQSWTGSGSTFTKTASLQDPAGTKKVTLTAPTLAADYTVTLPTEVPAGLTWPGSGTAAVGDVYVNSTGLVYVCDTAGTIGATEPSGTSADQTPSGSTSRWDYYAADYRQPLLMMPSGVLLAARLTNAQQNFGTPVEARDVAIKSYVDSVAAFPDSAVAAATWTSLTVGGANCSGSAAYSRRAGIVYLKGSITCSGGAAPTLTALPQYYRPASTLTFGIGFPNSTYVTITQPTLSSGGVWTFSGTGSVNYYLSNVSFLAEQ